MSMYWVPIGFGVVALLLILLLARLVGNSKRRKSARSWACRSTAS